MKPQNSARLHSAETPKTLQPGLALKLAQSMAGISVPVLLVSSEPVNKPVIQQVHCGQSDGLNCLLDLQATSRPMLDWVLGVMSPKQDKVFLAVSNAFEPYGTLKLTARRMLAGFSVQASISKFAPVQVPLKDAAHTSLPSLVADEGIHLLAIHSSRTKELSPSTIALLSSTVAHTNILLWPPPAETALRPHTSGDIGCRPRERDSMPLSFPMASSLPLSLSRHALRSRPLISDPGHQSATPTPLLQDMPDMQRMSQRVRSISYETGSHVKFYDVPPSPGVKQSDRPRVPDSPNHKPAFPLCWAKTGA